MSIEEKDREWKKRFEQVMTEVCERLTSVERGLNKLLDEGPLLERLERAENKLLEAKIKKLEERVENHRIDCVDFRNKIDTVITKMVLFIVFVIFTALLSLIII